jgi:hypothetical protein
MVVFLGFGYNDNDKWVVDLVIPFLQTLGCIVLKKVYTFWLKILILVYMLPLCLNPIYNQIICIHLCQKKNSFIKKRIPLPNSLPPFGPSALRQAQGSPGSGESRLREVQLTFDKLSAGRATPYFLFLIPYFRPSSTPVLTTPFPPFQ